MTDHRAYVGPPEYYDIVGGLQLTALMIVGMREHHTCLDVGCGSLRAGRFIMQYLLPGNYYAIEPNYWLVEAAIQHEIGQDMVDIKKPRFSLNDELDMSEWGVRLDYIVAQSIMTYAPLSMVEKLVQEASKALTADGKFIATVFIGEEDNPLTEWSYPEGVKWTPETIDKLASAAGLSVSRMQFPHPAGQTWLVMVKEGTTS